MSRVARSPRWASRVGFGVLVAVCVVALGLQLGCTGTRVKPAELVPNNPEFTSRLDSLAQTYESMNVDQIMSFYTTDTYSLSFELPWKFTTGSPDHRKSIEMLLSQIQSLRVAPAKDVEVWRDEGKTWTTRAMTASWTLKSGDAYAFDGYHSAIWEQRDTKWGIAYEHFWGSVTQTAKAAPPPPPPQPEVAPPPPPPAPEEVLRDIFFDYDKWNIREDQVAQLTANAEYLVANPNVTLILEGHCDERGSKRYNIRLGEKRAEATRKFLIEKGVAAERLQTVSFGKERPFVPGSGEASWQANRRTHFVVKSK